MADGKIYITISDTRGGSGAGVSNTGAGPAEKPKEDNGLTELSRYLMYSMLNKIEQGAINSVSEALTTIGNLTGNYIYQEKINAVKQLAGELMSFGKGAASAASVGASYGGGWGALIATGAYLAEEVIRRTINQVKYNILENLQYVSTKYQSEQTRKRLGLDVNRNGSRTGGY